MGSFIIRRVFYAIIMLIVVSFVSFIIISLPAGDFMDQKIAELQARGDQSASMRVDEYRERYGLDKPVLTQYWLWISNFVQGDFGISFEFDRPVRELIGQRFTLSIILSLATLILTWAIAIPLGVPDRFTPEAKAELPEGAYVPFGGGSRTCIGMRFGQLEYETIATALLRRHRLELADPDLVPSIRQMPTLARAVGCRWSFATATSRAAAGFGYPAATAGCHHPAPTVWFSLHNWC